MTTTKGCDYGGASQVTTNLGSMVRGSARGGLLAFSRKFSRKADGDVSWRCYFQNFRVSSLRGQGWAALVSCSLLSVVLLSLISLFWGDCGL